MPMIKIMYVNTWYPSDSNFIEGLPAIAAGTPWYEVTEEQETLLLNNASLIPTGRYDRAVVIRADDAVETTIAEVLRLVEHKKVLTAQRVAARKKAEKKLKAAREARARERKRKKLEQLQRELADAESAKG